MQNIVCIHNAIITRHDRVLSNIKPSFCKRNILVCKMGCPEKGDKASSNTPSEVGEDSEVRGDVFEGLSSNQRSFGHYKTREVIPIESNYRNLLSLNFGNGRPSLEYLHNQNTVVDYNEGENGTNENEANEGPEKKRTPKGKVVKFGWMEGVLMPCLLNIWGVMLFLRLSWVVGEAGIIFGILIVILANCITLITTLSMSAVATNGQIKGGGIYYMISRALGPQFGGSIGLMFTMANSIAAATYIIGFVNSLQDMFKDYLNMPEIVPGTGGGTNDVRVLGTLTLLILLVLAIVGMDWVARVQLLLLSLLIASQVNFLVGAFIGPQSDKEEAQGFVGFHADVLTDSLRSDFRYYEGSQSFFTVFGVFFPAVTGIVAGANLSGDLKNPSKAIPKGTLLAIFVTFLSYSIYPIIIGASVVRHATGNVTEYLLHKETSHPLSNAAFNASSCGFYETGQSKCKYGSQNNFQIIELMSAWGPLIYVGCFSATLSSGIASLVGAPRVLQALAKDNLYPYIHVFAKGFGANNDPFRGYVMVSFVSFGCIMIGELNAVSSLLTNCFLASYAFINFSCFHASIANSPGWRPSFKFYSSWLSLAGGFICVVVMFLIDWPTAFITIIITAILYKYVSYRKPEVNWGSATQDHTYNYALKFSLDLVDIEEHVKNYRPQILLLSGSPSSRPTLVDFASCLTKGLSLLTCANIVTEPLDIKTRLRIIRKSYKWLAKRRVRSFYTVLEAKDLEVGSKILLQSVGLGKLVPNILFLGYKTTWENCDPQDRMSYFNTLHEALNLHVAVAILRVQRGFDFSDVLKDECYLQEESMPNGIDLAAKDHQKLTTPPETPEINFSYDKLNFKESVKKEKNKKKTPMYLGTDGKEISKDLYKEVTVFQEKQKGTIDVWWLYDDGGLTVLLPYILSTRAQWSGCKLRLFALSHREDELELEQRSMARLLSKFRISFNDTVIISDVNKSASQEIQIEFERIIKKYRLIDENEGNGNIEGYKITDAELTANREKTNRHLRIRELLMKNSKDASLIVMTLPIPRKNAISASLYMAWLEILTKEMPPFLLIRGNQTSVLTFYS